MVAPCAAMCIIPCLTSITPLIGSCVACIFATSMACGGLAWWITGIVWRFRSDGAFASGDIPAEKGMDIDEWTL